ncbi:MAG: hypothetical protein FIA91_07655 [Geobacter sp.]|nr:hypothetical protein [Geobacter sp.]
MEQGKRTIARKSSGIVEQIMKQVLFAMCCLIFMTGCMPMWIHNYYSPNADGGTVTKSVCRKAYGPPDRFEIVKDGVIIGIVFGVDDSALIDMDIAVPSGKTVKITDPVVTIKSISTNINATGAIVPIIPFGGMQWQIGQDMVGKTVNYKMFLGMTRIDYNTYLLRAKIPFLKSEDVKVKLPIITINNTNYILPEITFTKDIFFEFFMPINC